MKDKYYKQAAHRLRKDYDLDVVEDILLARHERVILFGDCSNPNDVLLEVVSGNLNIIGFDDQPSIKLNSILSFFDYNNSYGYVSGKEAYFQYVCSQLLDFSIAKDVSFPILRNGVRKWIRFNIMPSTKVPTISIFTVTDVTVLHTQEEETFFKTHTDSLTQVFNKYTFDYHYGLKYQKPNFHVMFMDLDYFKPINDRYGHSIGNVCLVKFAKLLKTFETNDITFYRLGGDEFIGLLIATEDQVKTIANQIIERTRLIKIEDTDIRLTLSMGVMRATISDDLARKADSLMYEAKYSGRDKFLYQVEKF